MTDSEKCVFCGCDEALGTHWPCPALPAPQPDSTDGILVDPEAERYSERVTLRVPKSLTDAIDTLVDRGAYATRSQALRAAAFEAFVRRARERPATSMQVVPDGGVVASSIKQR